MLKNSWTSLIIQTSRACSGLNFIDDVEEDAMDNNGSYQFLGCSWESKEACLLINDYEELFVYQNRMGNDECMKHGRGGT